MRACDIARNRESQSRAGFVLIARFVEPKERFENVVALLGRDARPVVVNVDRQETSIVRSFNNDFVSVVLRVGNEIGDTAFERIRAHRYDGIAAERHLCILSFVSEFLLHLFQQRGDVAWHRGLAAVAAREGEIGLDHALHLVEIFLHRPRLGRVADYRERKTEARKHGSQIVTDAVEHRRALLDCAFDAALHLDEGVTGLPDFTRALRPEIDLPAFAEGLGGACETQNRFDLIAQESDRYKNQDERRAKHPHDEYVGIRSIGLTAMGDDAHHRVIELDAYFDEIGAAHRIQPERTADLAADFVRKRTIDDRKERLRERRRKRPWRQNVEIDAQTLGCNALQRIVVLILRIALIDVDEGGDVLRKRGREAERDKLPVPLHEEENDSRLQQYHWQYDDEQRPRVKSLRHLPTQPQRKVPIHFVRAGERCG